MSPHPSPSTSHPPHPSRPPLAIHRLARGRPVTAVAVRFLAAIAIAAIAHLRVMHATAANAQDNPPHFVLLWTEPVSNVTLSLRAEPGSRCWRGACVDAGGVITLAEPLTVTLGTTATVLMTRSRDEPHRMQATWHPVRPMDGEAIDALTQRWRVLPPGRSVDLGTTGTATVTFPDEEGWWVLATHTVWGDTARSDVSWGMLLNVIDGTGEREFAGTYIGRFESSAFTPGEGRCYRDVGRAGTWWLDAYDRTGADHTGFYARYDAIQVEVSGAPWRSYAFDFVAVTVAFRGFVEPRGAAGASWARAGRQRDVFVTALLDMQPTLLCGGDKPDLLLADAAVDADGCERGRVRERIRVTVRNVGSQPSDPYRVTATDATGAAIHTWTGDRLAAGEPFTFRAVRTRWPEASPVAGAVVESVDPFTERFPWSNNHRAVEQPAKVPTPCAPPGPGEAAQRLWLPVLSLNRRWR